MMIITPYYWPILCAATHLMKDLAEGLADGGFCVTVLSNRPISTSSPMPDVPGMEGRILRSWNPFLRRMGALSKFMEYLWFMVFFFFRGLAVPKVDLIFVVSNPPLAGLPGALLARLKGAKMVYNLQDIFPDSAVWAGMLTANGPVYRLLRRAEASTYRAADLVSCICPAFSEYVQNLVPGTLVSTIPNWVDTDHIHPLEAHQDPAIAEYRRGGTFVVQYAGNMGFMQSLGTVLLAAEYLLDTPGIRFVFIGDGNAKRTLEDLALQKNLVNCDFLPMQPLERVPSVYNACDLGVIPLKAGVAQIAVPSKTWNYLAASRPVICCVERGSPLATVVEESHSGLVVPPGDAQRLAQVILDYRNAPDRVQSEGRLGRDYVETHLSRRVAIKNYIQMFNQVMGRSNEVS